MKRMIVMSYFTKYFCYYNLDENNVLLLNTLTSAIDVSDACSFRKIKDMLDGKKEITIQEDPELYNLLKKRGYIFDSVDGEQKVLNTLWSINKKAMMNRFNNQFTICPTMGCNLRCTYCFEENSLHENYNTMSQKQLETIFSYITNQCKTFRENLNKSDNKEIMESNKPYISLFGGEPLLKSNYTIVERILEFAKCMKLPVSIVSNGTTIDEYESLLTEYKDLLQFQITLDGDKTTHNARRIRKDGTGTFDEICEGIDKVLNIGIRVNLRINVDSDNVYNLIELKEIFEKYNWSSNSLFFPYISPVRCFAIEQLNSKNNISDSEILDIVMNNGWYGREDSFIKGVLSPALGFVTLFFNSKNDEMKNWRTTYCEGSMGTNYCFAPDGSITTCLTCVGDGKYAIGNFGENGYKIDQDKLKMWTQRDPFKIEKCKECKYALFCGGGCPYEALNGYGDINCAVCSDIEKTLEVYVHHIRDRFIVK